MKQEEKNHIDVEEIIKRDISLVFYIYLENKDIDDILDVEISRLHNIQENIKQIKKIKKYRKELLKKEK